MFPSRKKTFVYRKCLHFLIFVTRDFKKSLCSIFKIYFGLKDLIVYITNNMFSCRRCLHKVIILLYKRCVFSEISKYSQLGASIYFMSDMLIFCKTQHDSTQQQIIHYLKIKSIQKSTQEHPKTHIKRLNTSN